MTVTNTMQSRGAALDGDDDRDEGELASLVRRWMSAGRQERQRRDSLLRVAPAVSDDEPEAEAPEDALDDTTNEATVDTAFEGVDAAAVLEVPEPVAREAAAAVAEPDPQSDTARDEAVVPARRVPALPHRPTAEDVEAARRAAVLIDARRVSEDVAAGLVARMAERGAVNVCRAYADWSRADLGAWVERLRRQGLHSFHQFADDDDQALVAMAIDAVDIARDAAIDEIVIAGDMTSMLPLVHRLHAAGVRVVVVGPGHTPHDVRAACDEFIDAGEVSGERVVLAGRHRA